MNAQFSDEKTFFQILKKIVWKKKFASESDVTFYLFWSWNWLSPILHEGEDKIAIVLVTSIKIAQK